MLPSDAVSRPPSRNCHRPARPGQGSAHRRRGRGLSLITPSGLDIYIYIYIYPCLAANINLSRQLCSSPCLFFPMRTGRDGSMAAAAPHVHCQDGIPGDGGRTRGALGPGHQSGPGLLKLLHDGFLRCPKEHI